MDNQSYHLIISSFSVGTWLQTVVFYLILTLIFNIILAQLNLSIGRFWNNVAQRWMAGRLPE